MGMIEYVTDIKNADEHSDKEKYKKLLMRFMFDWINIDMMKQKTGIVLGLKEDDGELAGVVSMVASACDKKEGFFTSMRKLITIGMPPSENKEGKKHFHPLTPKRMNQLEDVTQRRINIMKDLGHDRYIYIQQIGVKPIRQGKGIGSKLLRTIFDVANSINAVCYLETETKENESLYQHLGFKTLEELKINVPGDDTTLIMYCMLRL